MDKDNKKNKPIDIIENGLGNITYPDKPKDPKPEPKK